MNVLSLFDGMSCGQLALSRLGVKVDTYYASEIDKYAMQVANKNFPNTVNLGDVTKVNAKQLNKIDLLIGGSPCQGFSFAGKQLNFEDPRSALFFQYVRILHEVRGANPDVKFLLENVKMKQEFQDVITDFMGVEPVTICSSNFSAQNRTRLYWTNIQGIKERPRTKEGVLLKDILEEEVASKYLHSEKAVGYLNRTDMNRRYLNFEEDEKANTLTAVYSKGVPYNALISNNPYYLNETQLERAKDRYKAKTYPSGSKRGNMEFPDGTERKSKTLIATQVIGDRTINHIDDTFGVRKLTPTECERLQTVPDGYTDCVSDTQRYKMLGNGWTIDVISYILSHAYSTNIVNLKDVA